MQQEEASTGLLLREKPGPQYLSVRVYITAQTMVLAAAQARRTSL